ncbi:molecular chaperone [Achromobacter sp. 413638]|uniref:fimbrial biogenesis chaperone n=1 Tax=Achromobacter sp. 413638 TaxID=3342385 RepID=UPI00370CD6FE
MIGRRILALRHAGLAGMVIVAAWAGLAGAARADMSVDGTRFVYPAREKAISVYVGNIGAEPILVQSWLDRGEARDANDLARLKVPFVLTPPLLRLEPNERKAVQLRYTGESLPKDRESLFWVNFLEVPVVSDEQNSLRLQLHLSMKVLFRPEGLQGKASDAPGKLRWTWRDAGNGSMRVLAENPTPYSVTFRTLKVRGSQGDGLAGLTVPPLSSASFVGRWPAPRDQGGLSLDYESVDDFGAAKRGSAQAEFARVD